RFITPPDGMFWPRVCAGSTPSMSTSCPDILCVEDDLEAAELICEALTDRGFAVRVADNGRDALAAVFASPPDLVLCDIGMPIMSGFDLLERLTAAEPRFAHMPFVFLTALADRES